MRGRTIAVAVNLLLRVWLLWFLAEVMLFPDDPRFAGKAIPLRNLIIVGSLSVLFPALHRWWRRRPWARYPWWSDTLYLSLFWLDMAGNSFNLYDTVRHFDLIPHSHGPGALCLALRWAFRLRPLEAIGVALVVHILLEGQEYYTDVFAGTRNVNGVADTVNDLLAGVVGPTVYLTADWLVRRRRPSAPGG